MQKHSEIPFKIQNIILLPVRGRRGKFGVFCGCDKWPETCRDRNNNNNHNSDVDFDFDGHTVEDSGRHVIFKRKVKQTE